MPPWRPLLTEDEAEWIARYLLEAGVVSPAAAVRAFPQTVGVQTAAG